MKTVAPILLALAAALSLSACASDGDMWGHHHGDRDGGHRDRDHDGDRHGLVGALSTPAGFPPAAVIAEG